MSRRKQQTDPAKTGAPLPSAGQASAGGSHTLRQWLISLGVLAALTLMMFADVLFTTAPIVLSNRGTDIFLEYSHWRAFGFSELKRGNLALWNPCLFSGAPFFGGGQAALLYPLNALFLVLPLHRAINWSIALHVFLAGAFTYAWAACRRLRPPSCFLSAVIYMFCGANFLHIYSGYLSFICGLVWAPLLFLAIDGLFETPSLGWGLLGMFAVAMQVLAGNPQSLFYTAVAASIYCALCGCQARARRPFLLGLAGMVLGGAALSAIQLFAGFQEWGEMLRSSGVPFQFAAMFSFPPENFLTLLAPHLFGDIKTVSYWGRCYLWEMSLFLSLTGFILVIVGAVWGDSRARRFSLIMVVLLLLLALGAHTLLFRLLYAWVPGFNKFRGNSKFIFLASLFLAMLAGLGFDELVRRRRLPRLFLGALAVTGLCLLGAAVVAYPADPSAPATGWWQSVLLAVGSTRESYLPADAYRSPAFVLGAAHLAAQSLLIAGATIMIVAALLWCVRRWRPALALLLVLAVAELFVFARLSLDHFDLGQAVDPAIKTFLEQHPGDYRIANVDYPNAALSLRAQDVWGYEPGVVLRYAQLLAFARGLQPEQAVLLTALDNPLRLDHPLLSMLRCRFLFTPENGKLAVHERTNYLSHVLLVQRCRVLTNRDQILSILTNAAFDPGQEVILETPPDPAPVVSPDPGSVRLTDSSTDYLTIEADLASAAILLIPDVYAKGWRARSLPGSAQSWYVVQPGDWCLRAIPLAAGHHHLRLEYAPLGFRIGRWVSLMFLPVFLVLLALTVRRSAWTLATRWRHQIWRLSALAFVLLSLCVALAHRQIGHRRQSQAPVSPPIAVTKNKLASEHSRLANLLLERGQFDEAIAQYQAAIDAQPANPYYLNNLAWVLATCPQAAVRNGARAVELAEQAERLSGGKNPAILGTLAAAYAEAGRLAQAVATAQRALELATAQTNSADVEALRAQIGLYQAGSPFRDASQTNLTPRAR
jgi:tetratricopeptide (TPR) repeat protein